MIESDGTLEPTGGASVHTDLRRGDRVRLRPGARADIFDLALTGQSATVDAVEVDFEGKVHVAVVVDADPGISVGRRRPGNRFFFATDEVELLEGASSDGVKPVRILVAGIGNVFSGDDGFGVEVAQRLAGRDQPEGVTVADYGIRGYDLAFALMSGYDHVILVDACPRAVGGGPGSLYVIEPTLDADAPRLTTLDAHAMNPMAVLSLAQSMGATLGHIVLVGCEPETLGPEEGLMGLSAPVARSVDEAICLIEALVAHALAPVTAPEPPTSQPTGDQP